MKRKTLTLVLCLLTVMSLVGVGFASWVISADTSTGVEGNIVVDTVRDERYSVTISEPTIKDIRLTGPEGSTSGWLTYANDNDKGFANLTVTYSFTVKKNDGTTFTTDSKSDSEYNYLYLKDLNINVVFNGPAKESGEPKTDTAFGKLFKENVIKEIGTNGYEISNVSLSDGNKTASFTVTIGYAWGTLFENTNPFNFYNSKEVNNVIADLDLYPSIDKETWADHANYYLTLLENIEEELPKYSATITVSKSVPEGQMTAIVSKTAVTG